MAHQKQIAIRWRPAEMHGNRRIAGRLSMLLFVVWLAATACTSSTRAPAAAPQSTAAVAAGPKGTIRIAWGQEPSTLAAKLTSVGSTALAELHVTFNSALTYVDEKGAVHPQLAAAIPTIDGGDWVLNPDGTMITTYHHGKMRPGTTALRSRQTILSSRTASTPIQRFRFTCGTQKP